MTRSKKTTGRNTKAKTNPRSSEKKRSRRSGRSTGWGWQEHSFALQVGILSYTPNPSWSDDPASESFDLAREVLPRFGGSYDIERKFLCSWAGISYACWRNKIWRWAMELRYRHGDETAISILDQESRDKLDAAVELMRKSYTNDSVATALIETSTSDRCRQLIAYEYAYARANDNLDEKHPLNLRLSDPAFWNYMELRYPGPLHNTGAMRYLGATARHLDLVTGELLSLLVGLEEPYAGRTDKRFPELAGTKDVPTGVEIEDIVPFEEFATLTNCYRENLKLPSASLTSILRVWVAYAMDEKLQEGGSSDSTIQHAVAVLKKLRPDLYAEYRSQVRRFRSDFVRPLVSLPEPEGDARLKFVAMISSFRGALKENPLLNCVLRIEALGQRRRKRTAGGRPAVTAYGVTCAHAIRLMEREFPEGPPISVSEVLAGAKNLSSYVFPSVLPKRSRSQYVVVAPLLSCLFRHEITPSQIKTLANRYEKRLGDDPLLYSVRAQFSDHRIKTPASFQ